MGRGRFKERSHLLLLCLFGTYSGLGVASRDEEGKSGPEPALGSPPAAPGPPRRAAGCVRGELRTFAPLPPPPSMVRPSPLGPRALSPGPITNYKPSPHGSLQTAGETAAPHAETSSGGPSPHGPAPRSGVGRRETAAPPMRLCSGFVGKERTALPGDTFSPSSPH